jgi:hypothetical protein
VERLEAKAVLDARIVDEFAFGVENRRLTV